MRERGYARENVSTRSQVLVCFNDGINRVCHLSQVAFNLLQAPFGLLGKQFVRRRGEPCLCCCPIFDQSLSSCG